MHKSIFLSINDYNSDRIICLDDKKNIFEVVKIDPQAEVVAAQSETTVKEAILHYLGARDTAEKEKRLKTFVDLLEPDLKRYDNDENVGKVKKFVQMLRHPEVYKAKIEYKWFFDDKAKYLDEIFSLCVYVQHFVITKEILKEFKELSTSISDVK